MYTIVFHNLFKYLINYDQGQNKIAIILPKNRDTAIFNRLYIRLYIKFVANNGKNRDSAHAAISFFPDYDQLLDKGML